MGKQARIKARDRHEARLVEQRRVNRRHRLLAGGGGLVILGLLVAIVVSLVNAVGREGQGSSASGQLVTPTSATAQGAITVGRPDAPVRVDVYLDFMCPYCGRFERANGGELDRLVADGTVRLEMHPLSFLDRMSAGTRFSTRAANAFATVADRAPNQLLAFNRTMYAHQPEEGGRGLSDDEIANLAGAAGVPAGVVSAFTQRIFEPWVAASTESAFAGGVTGTPTVRINGKKFEGDLYTVGPLTEAIMAAQVQS
jgi:protein-disulfide isomerase